MHFGCLIVWVFIFYSLNSTIQDLQWTNILQGEMCLERGGFVNFYLVLVLKQFH